MENKKMDILIFAGQSNMEGSTGEKCAEPPEEGNGKMGDDYGCVRKYGRGNRGKICR